MTEQKQQLLKANSRFKQLPSCILSAEDIRKIFTLLKEKVEEAVQIELKELQRPDGMTETDFNKLKENIIKNFKLTVLVMGTKGERLASVNISALSAENIPEDLESITFECSYLFGSFFGIKPKNNLEVVLDFRRPKILDFSNPSLEPNPNKSHIQVMGNNDTWVNGVYHSLISFFKSKISKRSWVHSRYVYELILWCFIFPSIFWTIFRIDTHIRPALGNISTILLIALYFYFFFTILFIYRLFFNYVHWIFPVLEYRTEQGTKMSTHRRTFGRIFAAIITIILGLIIALLYDVLKYL